jgi:hypothetical protein
MAGLLRRGRARRERRWQRRNRRSGCLLWLLILLLAVIAIALFFGGFTKGTKVGSIPAPARVTVTTAPHSPVRAVSVPAR